MKVAIRDIEKTTGLFKKVTHKGVAVNVTLSPDEIAVMERAGLNGYNVTSFRYSKEWQEVSRENGQEIVPGMGMFIAKNGEDIEVWVDNLVEAEEFKEAFKEDLVALKQAIEKFSAPSKDETFEL